MEKAKADTKLTPAGLPIHRFRTLLDALSSMALNQLCPPSHGESQLSVVTAPTLAWNRAFQLLGARPNQYASIRLSG